VAPGGVEPHTHLAHVIRTHPDEPGLTLGPEDDTRGMACGGTTTHIDFCFVRPGDEVARAIEERSERWAGRSLVDYAFHVTLCGALPPKTFEQIPEAIQAGFPSFKVFTTDVLPPHPKRAGFRLDMGRIQRAMGEAARHGGLLVVHGEDDELVQWNYETFRAAGRLDAANMHLVHTKLSEQLAFRRTCALARAMDAAVYFLQSSAPRPAPRGPRGGGGGPRRGPARLRGDAPPVRVLRRRPLPRPARSLRPYLSVAQAPRGPGGPLGRPRQGRRVGPGHRRVPDVARPEAPRPDDRGRDGREPGGRGAPRHLLHRGGGEARGDRRAVRRRHRLQRRADLRALPAEGRDHARQRRRPRPHRSADPEDAHPGGLPRGRLQPVGRVGGLRLAGDDAPPRPGHRRPRPGG